MRRRPSQRGLGLLRWHVFFVTYSRMYPLPFERYHSSICIMVLLRTYTSDAGAELQVLNTILSPYNHLGDSEIVNKNSYLFNTQ